MPFNGQNGHIQWTQWTSIGSILMCPIDPLTALQLVNCPFLVHPVQLKQCIHRVTALCPLHTMQMDVQWTKYTSNGHNGRPCLGVL